MVLPRGFGIIGVLESNFIEPAHDKQDFERSPIYVPAVEGGDVVESMSVDQICEENIQLFIRCEEHKQKEAELKDVISKVEKELGETQ